MAYSIFRADEIDWQPRAEGDPRSIARISDALRSSRATFWRYPPGTRGKRHAEQGQEEVFVVLDGTLTIDLGDPPERHSVERGGAVVVPAGTALQVRNAGDEELRLFIYGAPPDTSSADYLDDIPE